MHARVSGGQAGFRVWAKGLLALCTMVFLIFADAVISQSALAQAQAPDRPAKLRQSDQVLVRNIYRFRPDLADSLTRALEGVSDYKESRKIVKKFRDRVKEEYNDTIKIPDKIMDRSRMDKYVTDYLYVDEYLDVMADSIEKYSNRYRSRFDLEDDVIRKANFADYKELYDFLNKKYPRGRGLGFLAALERLKENDQAKYIETLHRLIDELKEFRSPSSSAGSPCKIICNSPAQSPQSRAWCKSHCRDDVRN